MNHLPQISITVSENAVTVVSPYHPDFVTEARRLNGRFKNGAWAFDPRLENEVRNAVRSVYGWTGEPDERLDLITVEYVIDDADPNPLFLFGRLIADRRSRDARVKLGDGVIIVDGKFPPSGGSARYPELFARYGKSNPVTVRIYDVPRHLAVGVEGVQIMDDAKVQDSQTDQELVLQALADNPMALAAFQRLMETCHQ